LTSQETPASSLSEGLKELFGQQADPGQVQQLLAYLELLARWNTSYNLTAVRDPLEMVSRHLLDSLSVLPWVRGEQLLDAGTGAGLPGIPLAIMQPELKVTLLDSTGKKIRFLRHVKRKLFLDNIQPVQARLESWQSEKPPQVNSVEKLLVPGLQEDRHLVIMSIYQES
jgi:16S rRNA (guanine527-N7)-methyltransferase